MVQSVEFFWQKFLNKHPQYESQAIPSAFYFCDNEHDANECAELVVKGIKQATATSQWWYDKHKKPLPKIGDKYIVTDWDGNAKAIIETTKVEAIPFNKITPEYAEIEGEGDKSLAYWRKVHRAYYTREMAPYGNEFNEDMVIIFESFTTVFS